LLKIVETTMKKNVFSLILNTKVIFTFAFIFHISLSHSQSIAKNTSNDFWKQLKSDYQFGEYVRAFFKAIMSLLHTAIYFLRKIKV